MLDDDPGWPLRPMLRLLLLPGYVRLLDRRSRESGADGLILTRQVFSTFVVSLLLFGVVLTFLWPGQSKNPPSNGSACLLLVAAAAAFASQRFFRRPLDCSSDATLADSYRERFFRRVGFAEVPALVGFVGFFTTNVWWVYPAGLGLSLAGFAAAAPTRGHLQRDQEHLASAACFRSLTAALRSGASNKAR